MTLQPESFDVVVIGSGPAGQKAAVQAAKAGKRVCLVERDAIGGACVHHGTIPSKTLRETAVHLAGFRVRAGKHIPVQIPADLQLQSLMDRKDAVVDAHVAFLQRQMERNGIEQRHGRARFLTPHVLEVESVFGDRALLRGAVIVIATGSRPRAPQGIPIDHERILDSDSILSLSHLPRTMTVLGSGVIACEYATIFAALGVRVTMIDKGPKPLAFLPKGIVERFVAAFERNEGCVFVGPAEVQSVQWNGVDAVVTKLTNGWEATSDVLLCALGRVANVEGLCLEAAGLATNARGHIPVDADCRTSVPHIYAVGDVIGPPSLASASMEQGRRAMRAALSLPRAGAADTIPAGIYTIPEIATIGVDADAARARGTECVTGTARFDEIARGQIAACTDGVLQLVVEVSTRRVLGCQVLGEGATELVHLAQMAMASGAMVDTFVDGIFNFPTMAEAYRVAALDAAAQLAKLAPQHA